MMFSSISLKLLEKLESFDKKKTLRNSTFVMKDQVTDNRDPLTVVI